MKKTLKFFRNFASAIPLQQRVQNATARTNSRLLLRFDACSYCCQRCSAGELTSLKPKNRLRF